MTVVTKTDTMVLNDRADQFLRFLLGNGYTLVDYVSDWAGFAWEKIHGAPHPSAPLSPGCVLYPARREEDFTSETVAVQLKIERIFSHAFGASGVEFIAHDAIKQGTTYWVRKNEPVDKHVVLNKNTNQFFLCFNGIPVFHVNLGYKEPYTEPAYAIRKVGFLEDSDNVLLGKEEDRSMFFSYTMSLSTENFKQFIVNDEKIVDYCLGAPVVFDENWIGWNSNHISKTWDYVTTPALQMLEQWGWESGNRASVVNRLAFNPTFPEKNLQRLIVENRDQFSPRWSFLVSEKRELSKPTLTAILNNDCFTQDTASLYTLLEQKEAPISLIIQKLPYYIRLGVLWNKPSLISALAEHPVAVSEYLTKVCHYELTSVLPSPVLASYLLEEIRQREFYEDEQQSDFWGDV